MNAPLELQNLLCEQWCANIVIEQDSAGIRLSLPFTESDGDAVTIWINQRLGGWHLRDCGTTFMRLSYEMDIDLLAEGQRAKVLERILDQHQLRSENGEMVCEVEEHELGAALLRFGQATLRIGDIKLWSRARVANTFYEDLKSRLINLVGFERLRIDYEVPEVPDAGNYLVDFAITDAPRPLYIFGVPTSDKAKLANIILLHLQQANHIFDSLIVPSDIDSISKPDLRRLMNAANDFVDSSSSIDVMERKIRLRIGA